MTSFETFNQFDARFKVLDNFGNDCSACPFFGLITAYNFLSNNGNIAQKQHESNLYDAISSYIIHSPPKYMGFDHLLDSNYVIGENVNPSKVCASTPELVREGIVGWDAFFPEMSTDNCTIFLKNSNFFVIMIKKTEDSIKWAVRDCHLNQQWDFDDFEELKSYLTQTYRFTESTVVDGVPIPEFDNIEFLNLSQQFNILI